MSSLKPTKVTQAARVHSLIAGTELHSPNGPLTLGGVSFTTQTLIQELTTLANAFSAVDTAKASWKGALKNLADAQAKVGPTLGAYRSWVKATYGNAPAILADFGLAPPKARAPLTTEQQAAAVAKRKATKAARHTMGTVQKKAVKGNVTGVVVTPIPAPSPTAASPAAGPAVQTASPTGSPPHTA